MVETLVPVGTGLAMLMLSLARIKRDLYISGMLFLIGGLVLLLYSGLDVVGITRYGLQQMGQ